MIASPTIPAELGSACLFPTTHRTEFVQANGKFVRQEQHESCDAGGSVAEGLERYTHSPDVVTSSVEVRGSTVIVHSTVRNPVSQQGAKIDFSIVPGRPGQDGSARADFGDAYLDGEPLRNRSDLRALGAMIPPAGWTGDVTDGRQVVSDEDAAVDHNPMWASTNNAM